MRIAHCMSIRQVSLRAALVYVARCCGCAHCYCIATAADAAVYRPKQFTY